MNVGDCKPEHFKLAPMLREAVRKTDANYIKKLQCGHEHNQTGMKIGDNTGIVQICCFTIVWCDFPMYNEIFGWDELLSLIYRKCMVPTVVTNSIYGSKSIGNSIQLLKPNLLFNLGQTQFKLEGTKN